MNKESTKTNK